MKIWGRRAVTVTGYVLAWVFVSATLPVTLLLAFAVDAVRRNRLATVRALLMAAVFLSCEMVGIATSLLIWLFSFVWLGGDKDRYLRWNFNLQQWWIGTLFASAQRIYRLKLEVTGDNIETGPVIVFIRHTSLADTMLPAALFSRQKGDKQGLMLRYVLKRELLWDPCIDIVGNRIPNAFVERGTGNIAGGVAVVQRLMHGLTDRDGILIYPEGTRFTPEKRKRALARMAQRGESEIYKKACALNYVLPPRLGGPLSILELNEHADAVFCVHTGLEVANTARDLLSGNLVGRTIRAHCWRVPFADIPCDRETQTDWLYDHWTKVDEWVGNQTL
ncbi:MAG TPA: lysophospholipid acyltransferase family protein [Blastocatellia bacterium]|nr:lysophospholipid acyltransferase family protein [Blastocatellia bacterium]